MGENAQKEQLTVNLAGKRFVMSDKNRIFAQNCFEKLRKSNENTGNHRSP